jgi:hypothetical protein
MRSTADVEDCNSIVSRQNSLFKLKMTKRERKALRKLEKGKMEAKDKSGEPTVAEKLYTGATTHT